MKKKYLALFIPNLRYLHQGISANKFLIAKLSQNFKKVFIINTKNLRFFPDKKDTYNKKDFFLNKKNFTMSIINQDLKLPTNIEFFHPLNVKDFKNFMIDKDLITINLFGRSFNEIKIHFLLKYFKIKQVRISNIGNIQYPMTPLKKISLKPWLYKWQHDFGHKFTVLLSSIGLVAKIDINFTSNKEIYHALKKNLKSLIFKKLNFLYCKEHILVNSRTYDFIASNKITIKETKIILLDNPFKNEELVAMGAKLKKKEFKEYYLKMNKLLDYLSKTYKKKVIICLHPKDNLNQKIKIYKKYKVIKYATKENICKAFLVITTDTSAIIDAIFLKKKIIIITSRVMDKNQINGALGYHKKAGIIKVNLEDDQIEGKFKFLNQLNKAKKNYSNYINKYITPDGKNIGYKKIIKIIKKRFF